MLIVSCLWGTVSINIVRILHFHTILFLQKYNSCPTQCVRWVCTGVISPSFQKPVRSLVVCRTTSHLSSTLYGLIYFCYLKIHFCLPLLYTVWLQCMSAFSAVARQFVCWILFHLFSPFQSACRWCCSYYLTRHFFLFYASCR